MPMRMSISPAASRARGLAIGARRRASGQEPQRGRASPREARDRGEVLLGEDLGGRHERGLVPVGDAHQHRVDRNGGLAGTHIALDQAIRRRVTREIANEVGDDAVLGFGEREGQAIADMPIDGGVVPEGRGLHRDAQVRALHRDAELQEEEFVVRQSPARERLVHRHGAMEHAIRLTQRRE